MKIIDQSYEIIDRDSMTPAQLIEVAGRTCYKSEDKITADSADAFVKMIVKRGHLSVLEHATLAINFPWVPIRVRGKYFNISEREADTIVSGNLRAWIEFVQEYNGQSFLSKNEWKQIKIFVHDHCEPAYAQVFDARPMLHQSVSISVMQTNDMTREERYLHEYKTVRFITNRGVTHELVRHRPASFSQESTRYCNYGGKEMEFIKPVWFIDDESFDVRTSEGTAGALAQVTFRAACELAESRYNDLMKLGWRPEQAREVLPNALKTEIVVTANMKEWDHILKLRTSKAAHPQIRALMEPLKAELFGEDL